jgi:hypothetical protein
LTRGKVKHGGAGTWSNKRFQSSKEKIMTENKFSTQIKNFGEKFS